MPKSCPSCKIIFATSDFTVKCSACGVFYHVSCTKIRTESKFKSMGDAKDTWKCDGCRIVPASNPCSTEISSGNNESKNQILEAIKALSVKIDENLLETSALNSKMEKTNNSIIKLQETIDTLKNENSVLKAQVEELTTKNTNLKEEIHDLKLEVCDLQQYSRRDNVEIVGIPLTKEEDVYSVVAAVATALKVPYSREMVSVAHRVPKSKERKGHPPIVVRFVSRSTRDIWMAASRDRTRGRMKTTDVHPALRPGDVFINEHLTPFSKMLLYRAKSLVKEGKLKYAWVRDGKVLVKKETDSRAVRICDPEGLSQI